MGRGRPSAASSFLLFNSDAATSAQVPTPLPTFVFPCATSLSGLQNLSESAFCHHTQVFPIPDFPGHPFQASWISNSWIRNPSHKELPAWPGQGPAPVRPGVPTCSPAAGTDPSVSQKSVKFLEVGSYILLHALLEIMNDLKFSLPQKRNKVAAPSNGVFRSRRGPGLCLCCLMETCSVVCQGEVSDYC